MAKMTEKMKWTTDQQKVIDTRGDSILVSAAAGSGKTAVLTERILNLIQKDDLNIDELLIVTFTKAAAGEMRSRIAQKLADARDADPGNDHLAEQTTLIHNAQITTIDGFCSYIIRNYAHEIGLVPGFRVVEEGEAKLLKSDAVNRVLEEAYAEEDPQKQAAFHAFVHTFARDVGDADLEDLILQVHEAAICDPDPVGWLDLCRKNARADTLEAFKTSPWFKSYMAGARDDIDLVLLEAQQNLDLAQEEDGPGFYLSTAEADLALAHALQEAEEDYGQCQRILFSCALTRLAVKKKSDPEPGPGKVDAFKVRRERIKKLLEELKTEYYAYPLKEAFDHTQKSNGPLLTLLDLAQKLLETYDEAKRKNSLMDFSDLEHNALKILRKSDGTRTDAARELAGRFRAVMIDEYQDSNYLQEAILTAVSRMEEEDPEQNYFCVGDVKQSIYSFRNARPDLFMQKYKSYARADRPGTRIDLHQNFRSRREVVDTVNGIFRQIMRREIGGVEYDDDAALTYGAGFGNGPGFTTEIIPVLNDKNFALSGDQLDELDNPEEVSARETEARAVGKRIRELVGSMRIEDRDQNGETIMRPVRYRDIVILLRTTRGWADDFVRVLGGMGIPVYSESRTGYFQTTEVDTVLSYLSIVDNPQQDLPFTAVLKSPIGGLNADDLARVRSLDLAKSWTGSRRRSFVSMYDAARTYRTKGEEPALREKLDRFFNFFEEIRKDVHDTPLHELIYRIVTRTGYGDFAAALPGGAQRALNLRMLTDRAIAYEKTSYAGLFDFIRYIRQMKEKNIDIGELSAVGENEDVVRIYSIHKSKGLEYPVVFVSGLGKRFNFQDLGKDLLIHPEMGLASDYVDYQNRTRVPTMRKNAIRSRKLKDQIGEELRVLYVALTRAKQKLILTGTLKSQKELDGKYLDLPLREVQLPVAYLLGVHNYLDWILPAADRMIRQAKRAGKACCLQILPEGIPELAGDAVHSGYDREANLRLLRTLKTGAIYDSKMHRLIEDRYSYRYAYQGAEKVPVELSVSDLKRAALLDDDGDYARSDEVARLYPVKEEAYVPNFVKEEIREKMDQGTGKLTGALRGSAYHRVMEVLSFKDLCGKGGQDLESLLTRQIEALVTSGKLTREEADTAQISQVAAMVQSPLGQRMARADREGQLYREQPFVLGVKASEIRDDWPEEETVYVQGIIDAFFFEGAAAVLMDYKTDSVRDAGDLVRRYRVQLDQYANAISRVTGRTVKEKAIWSFTLGEEILL